MSDAIRETRGEGSAAQRLTSRQDDQLGPLLLTPELRVVPDAAPQPLPAGPMPSLREMLAGLEASLSSLGEEWDEEPGNFPSPSSLEAPAASSPQDPEAIRALVSDLLREELRGQLGKEITHTVRKLVQAEVARTLAARNLR